MEFSGLYLIDRLIFRFTNFFRHWYRDAVVYLVHAALQMFENVDRSVAFRITLTHFFEPLYGDYSMIGRLFGVIFRTGRIIVGSIIYVLLAILWLLVLAAWVAVPAGILVFIYIYH